MVRSLAPDERSAFLWGNAMSRLPMRLLAALALLFTHHAIAQRVYFGQNQELKSTLETKVANSRSEAAPIDIKLSVPAVDIDAAARGYQELSASGLTPIGQEGNPAVLGNGAMIAVPQGYEAKLTIVTQAHQDVANVNVVPFQRKCRCDKKEAAKNSFAVNEKTYQSTGFFPAQVAQLEKVGKLQGVDLVRVALHPLQMEMTTKTLRVTHDLAVRVDFIRTGNAATILLPKTLHQLLDRATVNGESLRSVNAVPTGETMLIITADELKGALSHYLDWQRQKGITPYVTTLTEAGGSIEAVKEYIQKFYNAQNTKPTYLLLVGSNTKLPSFRKKVTFEDQIAASDYPLSLLSGDDIIPDVLFGRLLADTPEEVKVQTDRWISYEKSPERGATWYKKGTTIASSEGDKPSDVDYAEEIQSALKAHTYTAVDQFYQGNDNATFANFSAALSEGRSWITYIGHGSGTSWGSTNDAINVARLAKLENRDRLPVLIDVACLNGDFANLAMPFGRAFVSNTKNGRPIGGVAYYGGSVSISWNPPAIMATAIAKQHFEKGLHHLGDSLLAGHLHVIEKLGNGDEAQDNLTWYNLFGDPSLVMRTDTPQALKVQQNNLMGKISIRVTNEAGSGVANLRVSLSDKASGAVKAVGKTNLSGEATLTPTTTTRGVITITGYNVETYEAPAE